MQNNIYKTSQSASKRIFRLTTQPLLIVGSVMLVVGCATVQEEVVVRNPTPLVTSANLPEGSIRYDTENARIAQLWSAAEQARLEANSDLALQRLFQALELSPQNSLLWSRAAEIQLDNKQAAAAEDFATKSNTFAGNNESLLHRNWLIIEHSRSLRGDLLGVRSAHKKVQEYQYQ